MPWRRISLVAALVLSLIPAPSWALFGVGDIVFDPTNYTENLATAVSTAATLTEAIAISKNTLNNIASLETVILEASDYAKEADELWFKAEGVLFALQRVLDDFSRLFDTERLPATAYYYALRRTEIYEHKRSAAQKAMEAQSLINSTINLINRAMDFVRSIRTTIGNKQANLNILQAQLDTVKTLQQSEIRQTAFEYLKTLEIIDDASDTESLRLINQDTWKNWGTE